MTKHDKIIYIVNYSAPIFYFNFSKMVYGFIGILKSSYHVFLFVISLYLAACIYIFIYEYIL